MSSAKGAASVIARDVSCVPGAQREEIVVWHVCCKAWCAKLWRPTTPAAARGYRNAFLWNDVPHFLRVVQGLVFGGQLVNLFWPVEILKRETTGHSDAFTRSVL